MIISTWHNGSPMQLRGMADSTAASLASTLVDSTGFEVCVCDGCDFVETAFVEAGGDSRHNDKKSFLFSKRFDSDTIEFTLLKSGVQVAVLNNSTYGDYYNFGSALLVNPLYKGFKIDWYKVYLGFGYGRYTVKTTLTSLSVEYVFESHPFDVVQYNAYRADGSVKIETYQSGSIMSGFDYTGIGWYQSLRINGKFGNKTPELIVDNYQKVNRELVQIQSKIENTYTLETKLLPSYIFDVFNEDSLLANIIQITDYNLLNQHTYVRFNVMVSNIKDVVNHVRSKRSNFVYEFKQRKDNIIKRNVNGDFAIMRPESAGTRVVEVKTLVLYFSFDASELESSELTITALMAGSFTSTSNDGSSGTVTFSKNGGAFGTFPATLEVSDTLSVKRTIGSAVGWVSITGLYE